jgi:hypothetical protein
MRLAAFSLLCLLMIVPATAADWGPVQGHGFVGVG